MKSGLYVSPGCSATACAAATASRLAEPVTKFSKRYRWSTCMRRLPSRRGGTEPLEHELRDRTQRLEHAGAVQRIAGVIGHAAEVDGVRELGGRQDEVLGQILLVVLDDERNATGI